MGQEELAPVSMEEYLRIESKSEIKYEYHDGYLVAMAGGSPKHSQLATNTIRAIGNALERSRSTCRTFNSDLKIAIDAIRRNYYSDGSVVCGPLETSPNNSQAVTNPILLLEVLSESTAAFDRGKKFTHYRQLPSFREYVLVSQDEPLVDVYFLKENGLWQIQTFFGLEEMVPLQSIGIEIAMNQIYYLVEDLE